MLQLNVCQRFFFLGEGRGVNLVFSISQLCLIPPPPPPNLDNTHDICMLKTIYFVLKDVIAKPLSADLALERGAESVLIGHQ